MRIVVGETYRSAKGEKIGPMKSIGPVFIQEAGDGYSWNPDGTCHTYLVGVHSDHRLISLWSEGPVRTVTRQEIIPGTYDGVVVRAHDESSVYVEYCGIAKTADQLDRAAAVLTALAGALRDGK